MRKQKTLAQRFWAKVAVQGSDECWPWTACLQNKGYGQIKVAGKVLLAHRVAFELGKHRPDDDIDVLHSCDNPPCCNPAHLFEGTDAENSKDKVEKGRQCRGSTRPLAKLTEDIVRSIRKAYSEGDRNKSNHARKHGVSWNAIHLVVTGRTWRHVK